VIDSALVIEEGPPKLAEAIDVVLAFWQDQRARAQRSEDQRAVMTNIVLTVSAVGFGFLTQKGLEVSTLLVSIGLMLLGLYGALASAKLYERYEMHMAEARSFSARFAEIDPKLNLEDVRRSAKVRHREKHRLLYRVRLHVIWESLHLAIAAAGLVLVVLTVVAVLRS
jgi:hypothetical protein